MMQFIFFCFFLIPIQTLFAQPVDIAVPPADEDAEPISIISKELMPPTFSDSLPQKKEADEANETPVDIPPIFQTEDLLRYTNAAILQGLNKITAHSSPLNVVIGRPITFGTLEITVHKCWKAPLEEKPENKALLEIWEQKAGEDKRRVFFGWMFSSSPGISALEHPVYYVVLLECTPNSSPEPSTTE